MGSGEVPVDFGTVSVTGVWTFIVCLLQSFESHTFFNRNKITPCASFHDINFQSVFFPLDSKTNIIISKETECDTLPGESNDDEHSEIICDINCSERNSNTRTDRFELGWCKTCLLLRSPDNKKYVIWMLWNYVKIKKKKVKLFIIFNIHLHKTIIIIIKYNQNIRIVRFLDFYRGWHLPSLSFYNGRYRPKTYSRKTNENAFKICFREREKKQSACRRWHF